MKNKKVPIIIAVISLLVFLLTTYVASKYSLESSVVKILDQNQGIKEVSIIDFPIMKKVMDTLAIIALSCFASMIVSFFITKYVDSARNEEFEKSQKSIQEAINHNVFDSLFKTMIPKEIYEIIKEDIIKCRIIRKNANWCFNFKSTDPNGDLLKLEQTLIYDLENIAKTDVDEAISLRSDNTKHISMQSAVAKIDGLNVLEFNREKDIQEINGKWQSNNSKVRVEITDDGLLHLHLNFTIPSNKTANMCIKYDEDYKTKKHVQDGYFTRYPVLGAFLKIQHPKDWDLNLFPTMSTQPVLISQSEDEASYRIDGGILPSQGLIYTLNKKSST